jgi:hypothetical protein
MPSTRFRGSGSTGRARAGVITNRRARADTRGGEVDGIASLPHVLRAAQLAEERRGAMLKWILALPKDLRP